MNWSKEEDFEPSRHTRHLWMFARKSTSRVAGISTAGMFCDFTGMPVDAALFSLVIILEVYGLGNLLVLGQVSPMYTVGFFAADLFFAILRHLSYAKLVENRNELDTLDETEPLDIATQGRIERHNAVLNVFVGLCTLVILGLAVLKIWAFVAATGGGFTGITLAIVLSYVAAAVIHIYVTGYYLFALVTELYMRLDHMRFQSKRTQIRDRYLVQGYRDTQFEGVAQQCEVNDHKLIRTRDGFTLKTWGILWDTELQSIIGSQPEAAKRGVLRACLKNQLEILQAAGPAAKSTEIPDRLQIEGPPKPDIHPVTPSQVSAS